LDEFRKSAGARSAIAAPSPHRSTAPPTITITRKRSSMVIASDPAGVLGIAERLLDQLDEASLEEVLAGCSPRRGTQAVHQALEAGPDLGDGPQESPDARRASLAVMEAMVTRNFGF
jgi:hypothetical protein